MKPTHWGSLEQRESTPEFVERSDKEFAEPPLQQAPTAIERRDFLKLMGASTIMATLGCARRPVEKIVPYVNQPEDLTPGIANWYSSTCAGCSAGCGLLVKTRDGRPIKLEGNPDHPMSRGGLCGRGQATIRDLYDPDRSRQPVKINRSLKTQILVTWQEADREITSGLAKIQQGGGKVAVLTGAVTSPSTKQLIQDFLASFSSGVHVAYEGAVPEEVALAQQRSYGERLTPRYRFDQAEVILSFGADFLGTWISPVEFSKGFTKKRQVSEGRMSRVIAFESAPTLSGTNADAHVAIRPGDELPIALAIANQLIVQQRRSRFAADAQVMQVLKPFSPEAVAKSAAIDAAAIQGAAADIWKGRGKSLVVGSAVKGAESVALQVVVNLLNSALGNDGVTVDWSVAPSQQADSSFAELKQLVQEMAAGQIKALIVRDGDPVFRLPPELGFAEALRKVPLVITYADRMTHTGVVSDWVCPDAHYLESWGDANPQRGLYSIQQPVIAPVFNTRDFQDSLIKWAGLAVPSWYAYLQNFWENTVYPRANTTASFTKFWNRLLEQGFINLASGNRDKSGRLAAARSFNSAALDTGDATLRGGNDLRLGLYASVALYDGRSANNGWLQELPDPVTKISWDNYLSMAPKTAQRLGFAEGDVVRIETPNKISVELPVHLQPKMHEQAVAAALGYGQTQSGKLGNNVGVDTYPLQKIVKDAVSWSGGSVKLAKTKRVVKLAVMQSQHVLHGRDIVKETTFAKFLKDPAAGNHSAHGHEGPLPTMWTEFKYEGHKWGMAVDLTSCTGCSACMIACMAENNVPVVGKEQVIRGRDMHWLRIDRYYSNDDDNPDVTHQPMLCQQCDNAPCESVCPTLATYHSAEGLNMMSYNRCVGTRYCANNCPYKVRRFNYFDYYKQFEEPLNLVLNPDVTTRMRGVMEKCTFCVQRIKSKKDLAKDEEREVKDGEIITACEQSCPSNAIVFGDMNDPKSKVSKMQHAERGYGVLAETNVKPAITYLTKVRNV